MIWYLEFCIGLRTADFAQRLAEWWRHFLIAVTCFWWTRRSCCSTRSSRWTFLVRTHALWPLKIRLLNTCHPDQKRSLMPWSKCFHPEIPPYLFWRRRISLNQALTIDRVSQGVNQLVFAIFVGRNNLHDSCSIYRWGHTWCEGQYVSCFVKSLMLACWYFLVFLCCYGLYNCICTKL